ncbi:hypothetical protein N7462_004060 [Penicillium macrosclerotiorum]|uniref:uncharacterized protein n=1 Tax=Penicillium macrosclerotiorum TaxID=303699 RepID=UPI002546B027|nr:uncharacterized protein N7462_004060 [Penicillium macrosclerotiorum]KAJ5689668.1 hypothetical protein N7462_004060 [Penicillium macrosclerotiorum]
MSRRTDQLRWGTPRLNSRDSPSPLRQSWTSSSPPSQRLPTPALAAIRQPSPAQLPIELAPPWPFNSQDTTLIRAGYQPAFKPRSSISTATSKPSSSKRVNRRVTMAEPRARAARHKGQMNFSSELRLLLLAYGDPSPHPSFPAEPLPETVRVLDEIVTDFILELCHGAAQVAHHARRQKIKVDDFRFALRRDPNKLGRVQELLRMERELKEARKAFDQNDDQVAKDAGKKGTAAVDELDGTESLPGGPGKKTKGKGKRSAAPRRESDATEESVPKKRKTIG